MPPYKLRILRLPPSSLRVAKSQGTPRRSRQGSDLKNRASEPPMFMHGLIMYEDECLVSISLRDERGSN